MESIYKMFSDMGFTRVGEWRLGQNLTFELNQDSAYKTEVLYAFVSDKNVLYVGKTDKTLRERMGNYKAGKEEGKGGSTNKIIRKNITNHLLNGQQVNIYLLANVEIDYKGHKVSISSGLEPALIKLLDPDTRWNARHTGKNRKSLKQSSDIKIHSELLQSIKNEFRDDHSSFCTLGTEYFNKGVFAFNSNFNPALLPQVSGVKVKFKFQDDANLYDGTYTCSGGRRFVSNKSVLSEWYQNNFKPKDKIKISVKDGIFNLSKVN